MRHLLAVIAFVLLLALSAAALDGLAGRGDEPVVAWVVTGSDKALPQLLASGDVRVLDLRAHGRIAQLYLPSARAARWPPGSTWATLRLAPVFGLPGCA